MCSGLVAIVTTAIHVSLQKGSFRVYLCLNTLAISMAPRSALAYYYTMQSYYLIKKAWLIVRRYNLQGDMTSCRHILHTCVVESYLIIKKHG